MGTQEQDLVWMGKVAEIHVDGEYACVTSVFLVWNSSRHVHDGNL